MTNAEIKTDGTAEPTECNEALPILTRFNQQFFLDRLHHIVLQTNHYDGTLPSAWEKIQQENDKASSQEEDVAFTATAETGNEEKSMRHIQLLLQRIRNAGIIDVVLEAAHAYLYQSMDDNDFVRSLELQYAETKKLADILTKNRINIHRVLFIDNYNPNPVSGAKEDNLDIEEYFSLAKACSFPPDFLIWEADMVPVAKAMINFMRKRQSLVIEKENRCNGDARVLAAPEKKLHLNHRRVELFTIAKDKVSCSALDAALSLIKLQHLGQGIINVLPKRQHNGEFSFRGQQRKVRQILMDHLGVRVMPYFNLFISEVDDVPHSSGAHNAFRKKSH